MMAKTVLSPATTHGCAHTGIVGRAMYALYERVSHAYCFVSHCHAVDDWKGERNQS